MATLGFTAEKTLAPSKPTYRRVSSNYHPDPSDQVVAAYNCFDFKATCDCFGFWDCLKCTYDMWPRPCSNPFG